MGCGDWIMATGQARVLKEKEPKAKILIGDGRIPHWEPWFGGNPDITDMRSLGPGDAVRWVISCAGARPYLDYERTTPTHQVFREDHRPHPGRIFVPEGWRVEAEKALKAAKVSGPFVVIEPHTKGGFGGNKVWPLSNWEKLIRLCGREYQFVQIGAKSSPALSGVKRVVTKNQSHALGVIEKAACVVTTDGMLHHAAAAFNVPAVVLWGARVRPIILGYPTQKNIYTGNGKDCGAIEPCQHCAAGMKAITPEMVAEQLKCALSR